jgi:hypothetical protein
MSIASFIVDAVMLISLLANMAILAGSPLFLNTHGKMNVYRHTAFNSILLLYIGLQLWLYTADMTVIDKHLIISYGYPVFLGQMYGLWCVVDSIVERKAAEEEVRKAAEEEVREAAEEEMPVYIAETCAPDGFYN